jgi:hypothetical protein
LPSSAHIAGPALIELPTSTIVVPEDLSVTLSSGGDFLLQPSTAVPGKTIAGDAAQSRHRELQLADGS